MRAIFFGLIVATLLAGSVFYYYIVYIVPSQQNTVSVQPVETETAPSQTPSNPVDWKLIEKKVVDEKNTPIEHTTNVYVSIEGVVYRLGLQKGECTSIDESLLSPGELSGIVCRVTKTAEYGKEFAVFKSETAYEVKSGDVLFKGEQWVRVGGFTAMPEALSQENKRAVPFFQ